MNNLRQEYITVVSKAYLKFHEVGNKDPKKAASDILATFFKDLKAKIDGVNKTTEVGSLLVLQISYRKI